MATTPPGWYDDGHGSLRWWDGAQWTEHVATPDPDPAAGAVAAPAAPYEAPTAPYPNLYQGGYPGQYAGGYPGAYPDGAAPTGAFVAATEPRRSKLWIVWVVLGVVLLGIVLALTVIIPILLMGAATASPSSEPSPLPQTSAGVAADEEAAVAAVELYDQAWRDADCDSYFASTTENFRIAADLADCDSFYREARTYMGSIDGLETTIRDVETIGSSVAVSTTESYTSLYDYEGNETDEPQQYEDRYEYIVIEQEGAWLIDEWFVD